MRNILYFLILLFPFTIYSQEEGYTQVESIQLTPAPGQGATLRDNMRAHNMKYHAEAPYNALVFSIATGKKAGNLVWMMGPCTFTELDDRPSAGGHDEDWGNNVVPYLTKMGNVEYWKRDDDFNVNQAAPGTPPAPITRVRYHTVTQGQGFRINDLFAKVKNTLDDIGIDGAWSVWDNQFRQGSKNGRHIATVTTFGSWSDLDRDIKFAEAFNKRYGDNALQRFNREMRDVFSNTWDEFWTVDKYMSGLPE